MQLNFEVSEIYIDETSRGIQHTHHTTALVRLTTTMSRLYVAFEGSSQMSQIRIEDIDGIDKHVRSRHTHMPSTVIFLIHFKPYFCAPNKNVM